MAALPHGDRLYSYQVLLSNPLWCQAKDIEADFSGGTITSHAGLLLADLAEGPRQDTAFQIRVIFVST